MLFGKRERVIRRIMIVEDEPLVAFDNEHLLSEAGYEVVATVDNLADALKVLEQEEVDLVLSDIKLAGEGSGIEVAHAANLRQVPVLFVSAHCPVEAQSIGIGCLSKPYSDKALKAALAALDRKLQGKAVKNVPPELSLYTSA